MNYSNHVESKVKSEIKKKRQKRQAKKKEKRKTEKQQEKQPKKNHKLFDSITRYRYTPESCTKKEPAFLPLTMYFKKHS
jgi:hypothetical protein